MAISRCLWILLVVVGFTSPSSAAVGTSVSEKDLKQFFAISPTGEGLPNGSGNVEAGATIYDNKCAMCHGKDLQGVPATGGPPLVGGRNSLANDVPLKTVESYWPYATTLFDYIWRAMPFFLPGSLTADEVYALCAYILASGNVVDGRTTLDAASLPRVKMPNANGFFQDPHER